MSPFKGLVKNVSYEKFGFSNVFVFKSLSFQKFRAFKCLGFQMFGFSNVCPFKSLFFQNFRFSKIRYSSAVNVCNQSRPHAIMCSCFLVFYLRIFDVDVDEKE